jgi:hypothetical protein
MFAKEHMDKMLPFAAMLIGAAMLPVLAHAELAVNNGVSLVPPAANTGAVAASEQASTIRDAKKPGGQTLRCWQNGRLLYEGTGFRQDFERRPNAINVPRLDGDSVIVLDQKDSVCILSKK